MNAIRCPQCKVVNQLSAVRCKQCGLPFSNVTQDAYVSVPVQDIYETQYQGFNAPIPQDNEIGRKAFFWYRVYCGVLAVLYLLITIGGVFLAVTPKALPDKPPEETMFVGIFYGIFAGIFLLVFAIAFFLPRKPFNWIVGIVMIALGMTSCCFLPFLIPLLIYWIKPETKAYFGRN